MTQGAVHTAGVVGGANHEVEIAGAAQRGDRPGEIPATLGDSSLLLDELRLEHPDTGLVDDRQASRDVSPGFIDGLAHVGAGEARPRRLQVSACRPRRVARASRTTPRLPGRS